MKITKKQLYFLLVLIIAGGVYYFAQKYYEPHVLAEMGTTQLIVAGEHVSARVAATSADQEKGLMGVSALSDAEGMLFPFSPASRQKFWNQGMVMPFDLIWIKNQRVAGIEKNFPALGDTPIIRASPGEVTDVLELASGWADRHGLRIGDLISGL